MINQIMSSSLNSFTNRSHSSLLIKSGSLEALKWIAVLSMTIDHFNRFFIIPNSYPAYCVGRLAMPLFAFIFAYNLARSNALKNGLYQKYLKRLLFFGILATPGYIAMRHLHQVWPLNILFLFFVATLIIYLGEKTSFWRIGLSLTIFFVGGYFVEYNWWGLLFCMGAYLFCKQASIFNVCLLLICYLLINALNGNSWAFLSLPLIFISSRVDINLPRIPYLFYLYYPGHLTLFWVIAHWVF